MLLFTRYCIPPQTLFLVIIFYLNTPSVFPQPVSTSSKSNISTVPRLGIVPLPQEVTFDEGTFQPSSEGLTFFIESDPYDTIVPQLDTLLPLLGDVIIRVKESSEAQVIIGRADKLSRQIEDERLGEEGYRITVSPKQIVIDAPTQTGVFYGVQTLAQLIKDPALTALPCMVIHDWPAYAFRGIMDDISRGPLPNREYIKQQIRRFASMKLNMMSFYIEHVVRTESHPEFAPPEAISIEEWEYLSDYASRYHIQLVGSFQSLGHFRNILQHPQFSHLGVTERMLYPGKPEAIAFLKDIYREMLPAFNSNFFNINGDEAFDLGRGDTKALSDSIGQAKLYAHHVVPLLEYVIAQGKRPMMWGDIALAHPDIFTYLPEETIILAWDYSAKTSFADWIDPIREAGFSYMVCPGILNSNRILPNFDESLLNIGEFVNEGFEKEALGVLTTVWDDGGRHFFQRDWYGVAYAADQSWHPHRQKDVIFDNRFSRGLYQHSTHYLPQLIHTLNKLAALSPTQKMNNQILWQQTFPEPEASLRLNMQDWETVASILDTAQSILDTAPPYTLKNEHAYWQFTIDQYRYMYQERVTALQTADLYRSASLARSDSTQLLLKQAVHQIDTLGERLTQLKTDFEELWKEENRTYWLRTALSAFEEKASVLADIQERLEIAQTDWQTHNYLPPPTEVRLAVEEHSGNYFSYWLITGPFEIEQEKGPHPDFLTNMEGETQARPFAGEYFKGPNGQTYMWDKYASPRKDQVNLMDYFGTTYTAVAYMYVKLTSPSSQKVRATLGSNDGIVVYCNGEKVFEKYEKRSLIPDEDACILPLEAGTNHLLIKVDQWKGDWGFSFRIPDHIIRSSKYKYTLVN